MFTIGQVSSHRWKVLGIQGVIAILFGIMALIWPHITTLILVYLFGIFALFNGIVTIALAFMRRELVRHWWLTLLEGVVSILIALLAFFSPTVTAFALLYLIAIWAVVIGMIQIATSIRMHEFEGEWMLALSGVISLVLGIILFFEPANALLSIIWIIGLYAIIFGVIMLIRSFRHRSQAAVN